MQDGDPLGRIIFSGDDGNDLSSQAADIIANVDGTPGENDLPGELRFGTTAAGSAIPTTHMTIKSDGKIGIGISNPDGKFHIATSSAGTVSAISGFDDLVIEGADHTGISILTPSTQAAAIAFGDTADADVSWIEYDHLADSLNIRVNGAEAVRIYSNRDIRLSGTETALSTAETGGFPGIPTMAGDATGIPANKSADFTPMVYDTSNQELKLYDPIANVWRAIATFAQ